jgi:hypothetical protein
MPFSLARATIVAAVVTLVCFLLAGAVGQDQDGWLGDTLPQWLGNVGWFGFLLGLLVTVVLAIALLVRTMTRKSSD